MYGLPWWHHFLSSDDVVQPIGGDDSLAFPQRLLRQHRILVHAKQMSNSRLVWIFHLAAVLPDRLGPTGYILGLLRVVLIIYYMENASQKAEIRRNWNKSSMHKIKWLKEWHAITHFLLRHRFFTAAADWKSLMLLFSYEANKTGNIMILEAVRGQRDMAIKMYSIYRPNQDFFGQYLSQMWIKFSSQYIILEFSISPKIGLQYISLWWGLWSGRPFIVPRILMRSIVRIYRSCLN